MRRARWQPARVTPSIGRASGTPASSHGIAELRFATDPAEGAGWTPCSRICSTASRAPASLADAARQSLSFARVLRRASRDYPVIRTAIGCASPTAFPWPVRRRSATSPGTSYEANVAGQWQDLDTAFADSTPGRSSRPGLPDRGCHAGRLVPAREHSRVRRTARRRPVAAGAGAERDAIRCRTWPTATSSCCMRLRQVRPWGSGLAAARGRIDGHQRCCSAMTPRGATPSTSGSPKGHRDSWMPSAAGRPPHSWRSGSNSSILPGGRHDVTRRTLVDRADRGLEGDDTTAGGRAESARAGRQGIVRPEGSTSPPVQHRTSEPWRSLRRCHPRRCRRPEPLWVRRAAHRPVLSVGRARPVVARVDRERHHSGCERQSECPAVLRLAAHSGCQPGAWTGGRVDRDARPSTRLAPGGCAHRLG